MSKNPMLKKSKEYVRKAINFGAICFALLIVAILLLLNSLGVIFIEATIINVVCTLLGLFVPLLGKTIKELQDTTPWETYLSFIINRDKLPPTTKVRISYAAFIVVEIDGLFLLVKNSHGIELYQHPARTYPIKTEEEMLELETTFDLKTDEYIKKDYNDYRFEVPIKQIKAFYKRFCEKVNPYEYSYQDIVNDIVANCGLKKDIFANSKVIFKDRVVKRIEYKAYTDRYEMNVQDVCKLFLNEEQKKELRRAMSVVTDKYKFVQEDIVKRKGTDVANNKLSADIMDDAYDMIKLLTNNNTGKY